MKRAVKWLAIAALAFASGAATAHGGVHGWHGGRGQGWHGGARVSLAAGTPVVVPRVHFHPRVVVVAAPLVVPTYVPYYVPLYAPPVYVEPPVYAAPVPDGSAPGEYRYYCPDYRAYYPDVQGCPSPWLKVVP